MLVTQKQNYKSIVQGIVTGILSIGFYRFIAVQLEYKDSNIIIIPLMSLIAVGTLIILPELVFFRTNKTVTYFTTFVLSSALACFGVMILLIGLSLVFNF